MQYEIDDISALEILDSRGRPTLEVTVVLSSGDRGRAGVPSGASTGSGEAVELRDGDPDRFAGAGVSRAIANVHREVRAAVCGRSFATLGDLDHALIDLDATPNKSRIGANALVGVSMAAARAFAAADGAPLYRWLAPGAIDPRLPVPHFNVLNGGAHAANQLEFQEFMVAPIGAPTLAEGVRAGAEVYGALREQLRAAGHSTGLGDEGGFAPELARPEEALDLLVAAISKAGYRLGTDGVAIALDPAASEFTTEDGYTVGGETLSSADLIDRYAEIVDRYPVWSIEDGMGEHDDDGWKALTDRLGERVQVVGDDNFVTNPAIIAAAVEAGVANAALIKLNQIGTVTETLEAMAVCRKAGYAQMVSHRSGETTDTFIADLTVATGCGQLKSGAPARGERVAKYNRLLEIAAAEPGFEYGL
jgi:enolase